MRLPSLKIFGPELNLRKLMSLEDGGLMLPTFSLVGVHTKAVNMNLNVDKRKIEMSQVLR